MQWLRIAFAFMLILAAVPALSVTPSNVSGQGYVTITTQTTTTGLYTSPATTSYETTLLTTTSVYLPGPVDIPPYFSGTAKHCAWMYLTFQAPNSQSISASFTSQYPISFYLMPDVVFKGWTYGDQSVASGQVSPCWGSPDGTLIAVDGMTSYSQNLVLPAYPIANRVYRLVFIQFGSTSDVSVNFELLSLPPIVFTSTVSSIAYITAPTTELVTLTRTTAIYQIGLPFGLDFSNLGLNGLVAFSALIILTTGVVGGFLLHRRRKRWSATRVYDNVVTVPVSRVDDAAAVREGTLTLAPAKSKEEADERFASDDRGGKGTTSVIHCSQCGAGNLADSTFCRKCGKNIEKS
jgi:hypothetical protein